MNVMVKSAILCVFLLGFAMPAAATPIYKWVDGNGVVNYSTEPPPDSRNAKPVSFTDARVSSYDSIQAGQDMASQLRRNLEYLRNRADQLQRELDSVRGSRPGSTSAAEDARRRRLEECQRQRRVDCDSYYEDGGYLHTYVARPVVLGPAFFPAPVRVAVPHLPRVRAARASPLR